MCLLAAYARVGAIAALSTGLMISAFTPCEMSVRICVACLPASPSDEIGPTSDTPYFVAAAFSNATYELQKSVLYPASDTPILMLVPFWVCPPDANAAV